MDSNDRPADPGPDQHVVSPKILLSTWGALVVLTGLTYAATWVDLGSLNLALALLIATAKAALVALFFMHLLWDKGLNRVVFLTAIVFVAIFVGITLMDTLTYAPDRIPDHAPLINR